MNWFGNSEIGNNKIRGRIWSTLGSKNIAIITLITMVIALGGGSSFLAILVAKVLHLDAIVFGIIEIAR